jgi:histone-arginine methyltransferase CARM1
MTAEISKMGKAADKDGDDRDPTYFSYYQQFTHQQNMLQDTVRTSMYWSSILGSPGLFKDRLVMDLGAGSGASI